MLRNVLEPAAQAASRTRLPVLPPIAALVEIALAFGLILAIDGLLPAADIHEIRPHPFWIPVLLLSLQYGTVSGLLAASIAIALTAFNGFPEQSTGDSFFTYFLKIWIEPILWIGAAVLLGQFRMRQIAAKQELAHQVVELSSQRAAIAGYAKNLRAHCDALERRIAGRREPDALLLLDALHRVPLANASDIAATFSQVLRLALPGAQATLFSADATGLRLVAATDPASAATSRQTFAPGDRLYAAIVEQGQALSVLSADGERALDGHGIAAVPVRDRAAMQNPIGGRVIGMLKVDAIDAAWLGDATLTALDVLASAFAPAVNAMLSRNSTATSIRQMATALPSPAAAQPTPRFWRHLQPLRGSAAAEQAKRSTRTG